VSAVELVRAASADIRELSKLNAFVEVDTSRAMKRAEQVGHSLTHSLSYYLTISLIYSTTH
jgi:Asp-tRNA(Asn)/Glu-tRNA(Gln) amidotransferase A subunit family amidase